MKKILVILSISLFTWSCAKDEVLTPVVEAPKTAVETGTPVSLGTFSDGSGHTASGTVKVVADKTDAKKKYLSFENLKVDAGPDLYVYLAEDKAAKGFISVMKLSKTGTFVLDVPANADLTKQKYVLIWCQQFTVLFGSAKLE
ncbi:MAG: hypothetical protein RLZZ306_2653 [Bacteroidota bacterium]|jgi:hypothetical protein